MASAYTPFQAFPPALGPSRGSEVTLEVLPSVTSITIPIVLLSHYLPYRPQNPHKTGVLGQFDFSWRSNIFF